MAIPVLVKQPSESRNYDMSFVGLLVDGEILTAITTYTQTHAVLAVDLVFNGAASIVASGTAVRRRLEAGTGGYVYKITVRATTNLGNALETEGFLHVKDL